MSGDSWVNSLRIDSARKEWHFKNGKNEPK